MYFLFSVCLSSTCTCTPTCTCTCTCRFTAACWEKQLMTLLMKFFILMLFSSQGGWSSGLKLMASQLQRNRKAQKAAQHQVSPTCIILYSWKYQRRLRTCTCVPYSRKFSRDPIFTEQQSANILRSNFRRWPFALAPPIMPTWPTSTIGSHVIKGWEASLYHQTPWSSVRETFL